MLKVLPKIDIPYPRFIDCRRLAGRRKSIRLDYFECLQAVQSPGERISFKTRFSKDKRKHLATLAIEVND